MVSMLASSVVYRAFESRPSQTNDYEVGIGCFSSKYVAVRTKSKDWLTRIQNNVSERAEMYIRGLLFQ
jgi:hypothetical protein